MIETKTCDEVVSEDLMSATRAPFHELLERWDEVTKHVFYDHFFQGLPYAEIAANHGLDESEVIEVLEGAIEDIRDCVERHGGPEKFDSQAIAMDIVFAERCDDGLWEVEGSDERTFFLSDAQIKAVIDHYHFEWVAETAYVAEFSPGVHTRVRWLEEDQLILPDGDFINRPRFD